MAFAEPIYHDPENGQILLGIVTVNKEVNYSLKNSLRYFEGVILHEFTHLLGFINYYFQNFLS